MTAGEVVTYLADYADARPTRRSSRTAPSLRLGLDGDGFAVVDHRSGRGTPITS